ncbi:SH3 domain protein [Trichuris suis]|nr:SH3 domain protein [Trichuris suis]
METLAILCVSLEFKFIVYRFFSRLLPMRLKRKQMPGCQSNSELTEQYCLARAVYDNDCEWPNELPFKKGDLLYVLNINRTGCVAEGWCVCVSRDGKQGIAPTNRLKMLSSSNDEGSSEFAMNELEIAVKDCFYTTS